MKTQIKFEQKVRNTIKKYKLLNKKNKVIVACSGGKDSTTVLYLLKKFGYNVEAMIIDLLIGKWSNDNLKNVKKFCEKQKIKLHIINIRKEMGSSICYMRAGIQQKVRLGNCMICGIVKRWLLNKKARELGADKLVTGHNLDDEAETIMMNIFKGNLKLGLGMGPITGVVKDKKFIPRIKPLYFCTNAEIREYSKKMKFPVLYDPCPCSIGTFRKAIRKKLAVLEKTAPKIKQNIVNNFFKIQKTLRKSQKPGELRYCEKCDEPSRNKVCKTCQLMEILKG